MSILNIFVLCLLVINVVINMILANIPAALGWSMATMYYFCWVKKL